jgi:pyruvate/2-oxoglutarate/acetoin dehydrogenase E1 component
VGLAETLGADRCFDTPLCEETMTGFGLGAAMSGLRPIHTHIRVDFLLLAMNQLVNMVASHSYATLGQGKAPMVIRAIVGRGWGQGYQHSKTLQSYFAHVPGLKVVMPTTPHDAKGLMTAAIRDDNPVVMIEHRWLYWAKGDVPAEPYATPLGQSHVLREGTDVTVVGTSWMNVEAMRAAELLAPRGIHLEIVDPRSISPFDDSAVVASVKKTGRCIVADSDWVNCGFSAEVAARVAEKCWSDLKAPVRRIGFAETHCPTTRCLENEFYPNALNIVREVERMMGVPAMTVSTDALYSWEKRFKGPF